jgi:hypothetical protein
MSDFSFTEHTDSPLEIITAAHINGIQDAVNALAEGWIPGLDTWIYVSSTSFKIEGVDRTSIFTKGTKIKINQSGLKYFYVTSSSFSTDTTINVTAGSVYTLADADIDEPYYSRMSNPVGFPEWFNYTPTGVAASNVTLTGRFRVVGLSCECYIAQVFTGAITFTTNPTLPITASANILAAYTATANLAVCGQAQYLDSGTATNEDCVVSVQASGTTAQFFNNAGAAQSASSPITWANGDKYTGYFTYEI